MEAVPRLVPAADLEFDEEARFDAHRTSHLDDALQRLARVRGVRSATVVDLATGAIVLSTALADAEATAYCARLAEHVPPLLHRATLCVRGAGDTPLELLCITSRKYELLLCADSACGCAIVVEQDRLAASLPEPMAPERGREDAETRFRRLLGGAPGERLLAGDFASDAFEDALQDD